MTGVAHFKMREPQNILVVTALSCHEFIYIGNLIPFLRCVHLGIRIDISVEIHISRISE